MNKPELGAPPIFEEEMNCDHKCDRCGIPFTRHYAHHHFQFEKRLQAETQRADKAEEIIEGFKQGGIKDVINIYESRIKELRQWAKK